MSHKDDNKFAGVHFDSDRTGQDLMDLHDALDAYHTALTDASKTFSDGIEKLKKNDKMKPLQRVRIAA
jgi:hypothetical protein